MALQAHEVHLAALQQSRIVGSVGRMASNAAIGFDRRVLPCEWPGFVRMAIEADLVLGGSGPQLRVHESAVLIMAISAEDQAFVHPVMKRLGEVRLGLKMTAIAQRRLGCLEQLPIDLGRM